MALPPDGFICRNSNLLGKDVAFRWFEDLLILSVNWPAQGWRGETDVYNGFVSWDDMGKVGGWEMWIEMLIMHTNKQLARIFSADMSARLAKAGAEVTNVEQLIEWIAVNLEFAVVDGKPVLRRKANG